jgi:exopolysaccharide production protein ExoZ
MDTRVYRHRPSSLRAGQTREVLSLQYLRAVAALAVVIFHIGERFGYQIHFGTIGVDIFFVISGFIMWLVTRNREATASVFLKKRIVRIVPLYWILTLCLFFCEIIRPNLFPLDHPETDHLIKSLLFIPHISPSGNELPVIGQGWTLCYEMFFYAVFAISLLVLRNKQLVLLMAMLTALVALGFVWKPASPVAQAYTSALLLEFAAGILICRAFLAKGLGAKSIAPVAFLSFIAAVTFFYFIDALSVLSHGIPAVFLVIAMVSLEQNGLMPNIPSLKLIGDASYSIYLTHYFSILVLTLIVQKLGFEVNYYLYIPAILASVVGGVACYFLLERPLTNLLSSRKVAVAVLSSRP